MAEIENLSVINVVAFLDRMDVEVLFKVIWVPAEIKDKATEPLTSVAEESGKAPKLEEFRDALVAELEKKARYIVGRGETHPG